MTTIYVLVNKNNPDNIYKTGGGSSSKPQTRLFQTLKEAKQINKRYKNIYEIHKFQYIETIS